MMGYMKKMYLEMLLEPSAPHELPSKYSILENAVDSAILDLEKANGKGIFAEHRKVLTWTALRTLKQARENLNEHTQ
jgi:hypothetical protein